MDSHANFSYSTVATAPSPASSGTSLVVAAGDGAKFPAVPFNATIWPTGAIPLTTNAEVVRVTTVSTDTLTIVRAQEGSSARTVVVGDQIAATITTKTLTDAEQTVEAIITQASHGFVAGDVLRLSGTTYVKAQANSEANAEAVGIVSASVTSGIFRLVTHGKISGLTGLTAGTVYFLSQSSAGALTATEPTTVGQVSKPVLIADTTTSGWIFNMRGFIISVAGGVEDPIFHAFGTPTTAFDFDTSSLAGLTALGTPTTEDADTSVPGHLFLKKAAAAGVAWHGRYVAVSTPFTAITQLSYSMYTQWNAAGMFVGASTPSGGIMCHTVTAVGGHTPQIRGTSWTDAVGGGGTDLYAMISLAYKPVYLMMVVNSSDDVDTYISMDGYLWQIIYGNFNPAFTVGCIGLAVSAENGSFGVAAAYDFLRIWNSALDPLRGT